MKFMPLMLTLFIKFSNSLFLNCEDSLKLDAQKGQTYKIYSENEKQNDTFIIGSKQSFPYLSYNSTMNSWDNFLELYSLESYFTKSGSISIPKLDKDQTLYFSVCSFTNNSVSISLSYSTQTSTCNSSCSKTQGKCENEKCLCSTGYFGTNCLLSYEKISSKSSKSFKIESYSLSYFLIETSEKLSIKGNKKNLHFFESSDYQPSFFEFQRSKNEKKLFKPSQEYKYFSVFCGSSQKCQLKFSELENDTEKISKMITLTVSTLGTFGILVVIIICYYIINCCKKKKVKRNNFEKNLNKFAPKVLFHDHFSAETCSICLNDFQNDDEIRVILNCHHAFHVSCIDQWIKQRNICPNCKTRLS